ncbi:MAG: hypothetical protein KH119_10040 [Faecalibacterium prausnitzii]|nr:hypothetical protein [Faecalibacterium prausnitzii]
MLTTLAAPAFAGTWYIEDGNITISAGTEAGTNKVEQAGKDTVDNDKDTIITNQNKDTASSNTVTIDAGSDKVEVTLQDVNIKADSGSALTSKGDVTLTLKGDNHLTGGISGTGNYGRNGIASTGSLTISGGENDSLTAQGGSGADGSYGGHGIYSNGSLTISGGTVNATGGDGSNVNGSGISSNGSVTISGGTVNATGGNGSHGGNGIYSRSSLTISGGTVNATGGSGEDGGDGIRSFDPVAISGGTVTAKGGSGEDGSGGSGIFSLGRVAISGSTVEAAGGSSGSSNGGSGIYSNDIDLSGSLELTAKAGSPNGKALSQNGKELDLDTIKDKLGPGAKVTATDANGETKQVSIPRPVEPEGPVIPEESSSSSGGGSAAPSAPAFSLPGLTVTDKSGAVIDSISTQSGNALTVCVGRLTASFRISLAALRQLRAEGIETITFQTILCSTTLSLDELLAMGGEDAEVVLTHHIRSSTLTVGGKAV